MKSLSSRTFLLEFWKERGEKLMTCHLFLDNYFEILRPLGCFQRFRSFWNRIQFQENSNISILISWDVRLFWILSFAKDVFMQKIDCVFVLAIRGLLHMNKNFVLWRDFVCFNHLVRNLFFEKFSLKRLHHGVVENMCSFSKSYL